jgi:alkylation response protein AidB-like acyl-CoA dehydrogenase
MGSLNTTPAGAEPDTERPLVPPEGLDPVLTLVQQIVTEQLTPLTVRIDRDGYYPKEVLQALGAAGAYRNHLASQSPSGQTDLLASIEAMGLVSRECMSTGFMMWCQDALGWYLENSDNEALKTAVLPQIASGAVLGGTALSNPMKYFSGIEPLHLKAVEVDGGIMINGTLPWVSNLGPGHYFGAICHVDGPRPREIMALVPCDTDSLEIKQMAHFTAMEGTGTYACRFGNAFLPKSLVLADPLPPYLQRIKAGFILLQSGMALGLVEGCIELMEEVETVLGHVNCYLDDRPDELADEAAELKTQVGDLAADPFNDSNDYMQEVIQARLVGSELALRAANAAMLHTGARGYLIDAPAQRKLREAYFVAIVTPAIKHLRKELDALASK